MLKIHLVDQLRNMLSSTTKSCQETRITVEDYVGNESYKDHVLVICEHEKFVVRKSDLNLIGILCMGSLCSLTDNEAKKMATILEGERGVFRDDSDFQPLYDILSPYVPDYTKFVELSILKVTHIELREAMWTLIGKIVANLDEKATETLLSFRGERSMKTFLLEGLHKCLVFYLEEHPITY